MVSNGVKQIQKRFRDKCISCGKRIELSADGLPHHRCSLAHERAVEAAHRRAQDDYEPPLPSFGDRLEFGFALMHR